MEEKMIAARGDIAWRKNPSKTPLKRNSSIVATATPVRMILGRKCRINWEK